MCPMTAISDNARKIFEKLPADGRKLSGGRLKDDTEVRGTDYSNAKDELKKAGLVVLGKGRGGSMARVEGAELPEAPKKLSKEEALEIAREEKAHRTRQQKAYDAIREKVIEVGWREYPDADDIKPGLYEDRYYVEVWKGSTATIEFLRADDLL